MWGKHALSCIKFSMVKYAFDMVANRIHQWEHWFIHVSWWCWISKINDSVQVSSSSQKKHIFILHQFNGNVDNIQFVRQMRKCISKHYRELNANDLHECKECTPSRRKILLQSASFIACSRSYSIYLTVNHNKSTRTCLCCRMPYLLVGLAILLNLQTFLD